MESYSLIAALLPAFIVLGSLVRDLIKDNDGNLRFLCQGVLCVMLGLGGLGAHAAYWQVGALFHG